MFWLQSTAFGMQTLLLPVLIDVRRERVLVEGVRADGQVIHHAGPNPVPAPAVKVAVEGRFLKRR